MMPKSQRVVLGLFIFTFCVLGIMQTPGLPGAAFLTRVTLADMSMLFLVVITAMEMRRVRMTPIPSFGVPFLILLLYYSLGAIFSLDPITTITEVFATFFAFLYAVVVVFWMHALPEESIEKLIRYWVISVLFTVTICLGDWTFWLIVGHKIVPGPESGAATGLFRNSGQAGHYFFTALTFLIPLCFVKKDNSRKLIYLTTALSVLALAVSFKRASIIGFVVGAIVIFFFGLKGREKVMGLLAGGVAGAVLLSLLPFIMSLSVTVAWRFRSKFVPDEAAGAVESFAGKQLGFVEIASLTRPVTGIGLGATGELGSKYEIHSTYFGIFTYGGVLALCLLLWFIIELWMSFARHKEVGGAAGRIGSLTLCLLVGILVSWVYTYGIRKREFWLVTSMSVTYAGILARRESPQGKKCLEYEVVPPADP